MMMKTNVCREWLFLLTAVCSLTYFLTFPPAASAASFVVSPTKTELTLGKNQTAPIVFNIKNNDAKAPIHIRVYTMDYQITKNSTFVFYEPGHLSYSAAKWISIKNKTIDIPANDRDKLAITVKTPDNAENGGHYAVVFFEVLQKTDQGVSVTGRIGALVLVTVPGGITRQGIIQSVSAPNNLWGGNQIKTTVTFKNAGNVHLTTRGELLITDRIFNKTLAKLPLPEITVLPNTERDITATWKNPPVFGLLRARASIYYGPNLITFNTKRTAQTGFYIIPVKYILAVIVICLAVFVAWELYKRIISARKKESDKT